MYTNVTQKYKNAILNGGFRKTVVDLYYNLQPSPIATNIEVISGSITVDASASNRRSGSITIAPTEFLSPSGTSLLLPAGLEVGIRTGVVYGDKSEELVPVGKFAIQSIQWSEADGGQIQMSLADRSFTISGQSSGSGWENLSGQTTIQAISTLLVRSVFTTVHQVSAVVDPMTLPGSDLALVVDPAITDIRLSSGSALEGGDYWDNITTFATSLGAEIFFYPDGVNVILRKVPTLTATSTSVYNISAGVNLVDDSRTLNRDGGYNAIFATGVLPANSSLSIVPYTFVYDNDPTSPTYYWGPYGRRVFTWDSGLIATSVNATNLIAAAKTKLATLLGLTQSASIDCLSDPTLDASDIVNVTFLDGTSDNHMIQTISLDLGNGSPMSLTTIAMNTLV